MHDNGILLRNLDPNGIIITDSEERSAFPRIHSLDKAEIIGHECHSLGICGDIRYRAPEVVRNEPYDFKSDCWSFGVILYYMLTEKLPFDFDGENEF